MRHPLYCLLVALVILIARTPSAGAADAIWARREWEQLPIKDDPARAGLDHLTAVFSSFPARVLALAYEQTVDPAHGDAPVYKGYGDSFMRYESVARWGWSFETFFSPEVVRTPVGGPAEPVTVGVLRELNVLESGGERVMGDFVWPLRVGDQEVGALVLRCVIRAEEPLWLYARVLVTGDPALSLRRLHLNSFGGMAGVPPPGSEQWAANLAGDGPAPPAGPLPLEQDWFFVTHKHGWRDRRGSASIVLPGTLQALDYPGGDGSLVLVPRPGTRALSVALADFQGDLGVEIPRLRQEAAARRERLAQMDWRPAVQAEDRRLDAEAAPLVAGLPAGAAPVVAWQQARAKLAAAEAAATAAPGPEGSAAELAWGTQIQTARDLLDSLWPRAVSALISQEAHTP